MAETANIAKLAELLANKVFPVFGWKMTGSTNQNWPCEKQTEHQRQTHPSDVVFFYDEPYSLHRTYVNCDLKSYAKGSITTGAVLSAMESLASSLACAEISATWGEMYLDKDVNASIVGLLFVYNHDGEYDKNFDSVLSSLKHEKIKVPKGSRIVILGPRQIQWLDNVRHEIVYMRGEKQLPDEGSCRFHYPELVRRKNVQRVQARAATLEMLTGPWITLEYGQRGTAQFGYVIFYRRRGESIEEFLYVLDYLMHYQMVDEGIAIKLRLLDPDPNAPAHFKRAINEYVDAYDGGEAMAALLNKIEYSSITNIVSQFSQIEVGMFHG